MPDNTRTARSITRAVRPRKIAVSKITNARDALADFGRGMETYCLTFGQFSLMDAVEAAERLGVDDKTVRSAVIQKGGRLRPQGRRPAHANTR